MVKRHFITTVVIAALSFVSIPATAQSITTYRWKVLPPVEYDKPYEGHLVVIRGNAKVMTGVCPKTKFPIPLGCAIRHLRQGETVACHVFIAEDDILRTSIWDYEIVLRHERGHCNGWSADHPGMREQVQQASER